MDFNNRLNYNDLYNVSLLTLSNDLTPRQVTRLKDIRRRWNYYEGFHWEDIPPIDKPQITENYCRAYINKFVSFEFGKGFIFKTEDSTNSLPITEDGLNSFQFLERVWRDNKKYKFGVEYAQMKSITGDAWVQVKFHKAGTFKDPFGEHPRGRLRVLVVPTNVLFPEYDQHDKEELIRLTIAYPIEQEEVSPILKRTKLKTLVYKQIWTNDRVQIYEGSNLVVDAPNIYGTIPFIQTKNYPVAGREDGLSDLDDIIPLNTELNLKKSDISEIIDYHSAPITVVFGARISSLEKGANKIWGGLPEKARVQNLELNSDLRASVEYVAGLKNSMQEIGGIPQGALGGTQAISNTSGVALQFVNMPLIERTRVKRTCSEEGLEQVNKLILLVALREGLVRIPQGLSTSNFYFNEVKLPDTLPKDLLIELQQIEQEMKLGLEHRKGAMERLGKDNIEDTLARIDEERVSHPEIYLTSKASIAPELNSGMTNGETPIEQLRRENNGANMPQ